MRRNERKLGNHAKWEIKRRKIKEFKKRFGENIFWREVNSIIKKCVRSEGVKKMSRRMREYLVQGRKH